MRLLLSFSIRLLTFNSVKDRGKRVENESNRRILRLGYERSDLNVELSEIRRVPKNTFALPRKPRITIDDPQPSLTKGGDNVPTKLSHTSLNILRKGIV